MLLSIVGTTLWWVPVLVNPMAAPKKQQHHHLSYPSLVDTAEPYRGTPLTGHITGPFLSCGQVVWLVCLQAVSIMLVSVESLH